ncbi:nicotinate-nucleotide diphosphorylase (carboxylating) [Pleosporales sp. CAS-2024a]
MLSLAEHSAADGSYVLTDDLSYKKFFSAMNFYTGPDPTHGFVQYQDLASAVRQKLVGYFENTKSVYLGVDYTTASPKGRASVRVESRKNWNQGLLIADIAHMPASTCGTWPAFWLLGKDTWPAGGEIDIVEGVNDYASNAMTLHTSAGCSVANTSTTAFFSPGSGSGSSRAGSSSSSSSLFTGTLSTSNCDINASNQVKNAGCSIHAPLTLVPNSHVQTAAGGSSSPLPSYGTPFNAAGGGIYALLWTSTSISVYFFPYASPLYQLVAGSHNNTTTQDPARWGTPLARFGGSGCDFGQRFQDMRVIFDTSFCGDWAGGEWVDGGCARKTGVSSCEGFVGQNPEAFGESYWEIRGLRWYAQSQKDAGGK